LEYAATVVAAMHHMLRESRRGESATHGRKDFPPARVDATPQTVANAQEFGSESISKEK
jgi:hypothetical protein